MSFTEARKQLIEALEDGRFDHEERGALSEKNLLAVGEITAQEVVRMLHRCRGDQHRWSPHDFDERVTVHVAE